MTLVFYITFALLCLWTLKMMPFIDTEAAMRLQDKITELLKKLDDSSDDKRF